MMLRPGIAYLLLLLPGAAAGLAVQHAPAPAARPAQGQAALSAAELDRLWQDLAGADARAAYQSIWALVAAPDSAAVFLDERLKSVTAPDLKRIDGFIADLDSDDYAVRSKATLALAKLGLPAKSALERVLLDPPSPEVYLRVKQLLGKLAWGTLPPQDLQTWRAIETLEHIGTAAARKPLARLAAGHPSLWQSRQAQLALVRLQAVRPTVKLAGQINEVANLSGHTSRVYGLAYSPDGKLLASAGADGTARLWDPVAGKLLATFLHPSGVWSVGFRADGKVLASGCSDRIIRLWDLASGKQVQALSGHDGIVYSIAISPDDRFLASGGADRSVHLWELNTGKLLASLDGHEATIWSVAFSPDGRTVASGSSDRKVKLWEVVTGKERANFAGHEQFIRSVALSPDGRKVISADSDGLVLVRDVRTGQYQSVATAQAGGVRDLACSPDGKLLATAGVDTTVKLWELGSGKLLTTLTSHTDKARCVAFRPDGEYLATGSYDTTIRIWKLSNP